MKYKKEYLKSEGTFCPHCKNKDIEGGPIESLEGYALQEMSCNNCGNEWRDVYRLFDVHPIK